jgi:hypothetical protein
MTIKTTLSDEEMAERGTHSCLPRFTRSLGACAARSIQASSNSVPPRHAEFLVANLELEFKLNYRKQSPLKISNRKYSRVLRAPWRIAISSLNPPSSSASSVPQPTISNRNIQTIRNFTKPCSITTYAISNRDKIAFFRICSNPRFSLRKGTSRDMIPAPAPLK